jgi:hypothetical protein
MLREQCLTVLCRAHLGLMLSLGRKCLDAMFESLPLVELRLEQLDLRHQLLLGARGVRLELDELVAQQLLSRDQVVRLLLKLPFSRMARRKLRLKLGNGRSQSQLLACILGAHATPSLTHAVVCARQRLGTLLGKLPCALGLAAARREFGLELRNRRSQPRLLACDPDAHATPLLTHIVVCTRQRLDTLLGVLPCALGLSQLLLIQPQPHLQRTHALLELEPLPLGLADNVRRLSRERRAGRSRLRWAGL